MAVDDLCFALNSVQYDAFSMFDGQYPGAESATLSFITLFAVAEAVGKVRKELLDATNKHIFFVVFHGVSLTYLDSSFYLLSLCRRQRLSNNDGLYIG